MILYDIDDSLGLPELREYEVAINSALYAELCDTKEKAIHRYTGALRWSIRNSEEQIAILRDKLKAAEAL